MTNKIGYDSVEDCPLDLQLNSERDEEMMEAILSLTEGRNGWVVSMNYAMVM